MSSLVLCVLTKNALSLDVTCHFSDDNPSTCQISAALKLDSADSLIIFSVKEPVEVREFRLLQPSSIRHIPKTIFEHFPNLEKVVLDSAGITNLFADDFLQATSIIYLRLINNSITSLPRAVFAGSVNLKVLNIDDNEIETIENYAFENLSKLEELSLQGNKIKRLTQHTFTGAEGLQKLYLERNEIEVIEEDALELPNLVILWMGMNKLKTIPNLLCTHSPNLEILAVFANQIRRIGDIFYDCDKLRNLYADSNFIENVNLDSIARMKSLHILTLNNNSLHFSCNKAEPLLLIQNSPSPLTVLSLSGNRLLNPDVFQRLSIFGNLTELYLQNNQFTHLDYAENVRKWFPKLVRIEMLNNAGMERWAQANEHIFKDNFIDFKTVDHYDFDTE